MDDKKIYQIRYLVLPDFVFNNEKLTYTSAKVYAFIHNYKGKEFFFHNEKLALMFGCTERTITEAVNLLKKEGFIDTRFDGKKRYVIDLFSLRVEENFYADSKKSSMLNEAEASNNSSSLNEAKLATPNINNINNNNYGKNFKENKTKKIQKNGNSKDLKFRPDFVALQEKKKEKRLKPKMSFGYSLPPMFQGFVKPQKKGTHAEHIK